MGQVMLLVSFIINDVLEDGDDWRIKKDGGD